MEKQISFEDSLLKLDEIVNELENGNLPLDKLMYKIEESVTLIEHCKSQLRQVPETTDKLRNLLD